MRNPRRLLSISHSYVVALNRRMAHEMVRASHGQWEVTAVAPTFFDSGKDLRPIALEPGTDEPSILEAVPAHLTRKIHFFYYGRRLKEIMRSQPWDMVHAWEEPYILSGAQIARWMPPSTPLVYATFQNINKNYPPPFNMMERYAMRRSAGWLAFGETIATALKDRPVYRDRPMRITAPGVDTAHFKPDRVAGDAVLKTLGWERSGPPVVGYLGRFVPEKGLQLLMDALDAITTPWRALFVGGGPMKNQLQAFAARHAAQVRICGGVKHNDVPAYLNAMEILAAPSQTTPRWREQFGRMLIEAFACGLVVVASDSGEIPHVVGNAGVIVGENDKAAWIRTLSELLESSQRRAELSASGRQRALANFAWPVVARQHLDFFEELLALRPGA